MHFELFSKDASYTLNSAEVAAVSKITGHLYSGYADRDLIAFARSHPARYLDILEEVNSEKFCSLIFKVFPNQLSADNLRNQVFGHADTQFLLVRRNLIDSYISAQKALAVGAYKGIDTSSISISLHAEPYLMWVGKVAEWYQWCQSRLREMGRPYTTITYEKHIATGVESTLCCLEKVFKDFEIPYGNVKKQFSGLEKQDQSRRYEDKVENWSEFLAELNELVVLPQFSAVERPIPTELL